jgi:hypothetical protein
VVESHIQLCDACREFAAGMRQSQSAVKALCDECGDGSTLAEVRAAVLAEVSRRRPARTWPRYAAAAALLLALTGAQFWRSHARTTAELRFSATIATPRAPMVSMPAPAPRKHFDHAARHVRRKPRLAPVFKSEPLVVKMLTSDPQVVIYWLVDQNGG